MQKEQAIQQLKKAIAQYENSPQTAIDTDLLLGEIRSLYALLTSPSQTDAPAAVASPEPPIVEMKPVETATAEEEYFEFAAEEPVVIVEKEIAPVAETSPTIEEPKVEPVIVEEEIVPVVETEVVVAVEKEEDVVIVPEKIEEPVAPVSEPTTIVTETVKEVEEETISMLSPTEKTNSNILNESFAQNPTTSFNEKLQQNNERGLNEKFATGSIKSMIDFNRKFVFIQELFKGDSEAYSVAIDTIDGCENIQSAFHFITTSLLPQYNWDMSSQTVKLFDKLIRQKFGKI